MKKRFFSLLLAAILIVTALPAAAFAAQTAGLSNFAKTNTYADGKFTDVKADDWFEKNVSAAYELNLMVGKGDDFFDTENNLTVAEAMTIAARLRSIYYTGKAEFEQGEPWYQVYANYCKINDVADPADYDMNKAVTRGEFAEIFAKAFPSDALKKINTVHDNMIPDVKKADKFSAAIYLLYRAGILVGNDSKGTFAPDTNIKRAEAAAITTRMADSSLREKISLVDPAYDDWYYVPATPTTYTVSFDMQGHGTTPTNLTVNEGDKITKPAAPTATNLVFEGWYKEASCTNLWNFTTDKVTGDITLYAKWKVNIYTVTFDMQGHGTTPTNLTVNEGDKITELADPTATGYTFGGWYKDASCTDLNKWATATDLVTQDITLYAKWTVNTYTVTFDMQGHGTQVTSYTNLPSGSTITEPTAPTEKGYIFDGWYKEASCTNAWNFGTDTVTADTTLCGKWTPITYTIEFNGNGGGGNMGNQVFTYDQEQQLRANTFTAPADRVFSGWANSSSADSAVYTDKANVKNLASENSATVNLYAVWKYVPAGSFAVAFDLNGATTGMAPGVQIIASGEKVEKPDDPTYNGYTFDGWYQTKNDGGALSDKWDFDTDTVTGNMTLYANWIVDGCVAAGTIVTMGNGEQKLIEELEIGDVIRTFDHKTGEVSSAPVCFIWETQNAPGAFKLMFEDGIEVTVIEEHGFYDLEEKQYVFINAENANDYIGHHFYDADNASWRELKSVEVLNGGVDAYAIITSGHLNHLSNGILSMSDGTIKMLANVFEYDAQMKFDAEQKEADIKAYGLTSLDKLLELEGFTEQAYYDYNLQYLDVMVGKGIITWEGLEALSEAFVATGISSNPVYVVE